MIFSHNSFDSAYIRAKNFHNIYTNDANYRLKINHDATNPSVDDILMPDGLEKVFL